MAVYLLISDSQCIRRRNSTNHLPGASSGTWPGTKWVSGATKHLRQNQSRLISWVEKILLDPAGKQILKGFCVHQSRESETWCKSLHPSGVRYAKTQSDQCNKKSKTLDLLF